MENDSLRAAGTEGERSAPSAGDRRCHICESDGGPFGLARFMPAGTVTCYACLEYTMEVLRLRMKVNAEINARAVPADASRKAQSDPAGGKE